VKSLKSFNAPPISLLKKELILKINKYCYLLHLVGLDFITVPTLKMHGQTQIRFRLDIVGFKRMAFPHGFLAVCQFSFALSCHSLNYRPIYAKSHPEDKIQQSIFLIFRDGLDTCHSFFPYVTRVLGTSYWNFEKIWYNGLWWK
jgi:hypothetical protein